MQWLRTMGTMEVDWGSQKVTRRGDHSLTKAEVSLKMMARTCQEEDQGFLVEMRDLSIHNNGREEAEELVEVQRLKEQFQDVFELLSGLPPKRKVDHQIVLKEGQGPVNVRPYKYAHVQKSEIEKLMQEMLATGIIRPSESPFSSPVLLVKKDGG
ncbi:MAG: hypothetical protein Q8761_02880 [Sweet potato little leaf phytoplasma]|nr:hypothetical protein [Sweet potato little leaf phytoplasma]